MGLYRKVLKIKAEDSPNVRLALAQLRAGQTPTGELLVPGVLPWHDYVKRRQTWDAVKQCVGLDAEFYEGAAALLFPPDWLNRAEHEAVRIAGLARRATGLGIDPAEGGDNTAFAVVDAKGLLELVSLKTPDTQQIVGRCVALLSKYGLRPEQACFDRGGGGYQIACQLRAAGYGVRTVGFGEPIIQNPRPGRKTARRRLEEREEKYPYKNRRAEMYGRLRTLLDPGVSPEPFALPAEYIELRRQLAVFPLLYDGEGRMVLPPKTKKSKKNLTEKSLEELIGHSPDEADALALALHAATVKEGRGVVGSIFKRH